MEQTAAKSAKTAADLSAQIESQSQELSRLQEKVKATLETLQQRETEAREATQRLEEATQEGEATRAELKQVAAKLVSSIQIIFEMKLIKL